MLDKKTSVADRIDDIENAYEFMLAYAAQGRRGDEGGSANRIRDVLNQAVSALDGLVEGYRANLPDDDAAAAALSAYLDIVGNDAAKARTGLRLVIVQPAISSQMIDNLNASIHLRTLLTDLFILDSVAPSGGPEIGPETGPGIGPDDG